MLSFKKPEAEVRLFYPLIFEISMVASLLLVTLVFLFSKKFEFEVVQRAATEVVLETEEIPITQQIKRPPPPARPSIPVEDPDISIEDDIPLEDLDDFDWTAEAPPPPSIDEEAVDFFAVEVVPQIQGGVQALYNYLHKNNLYPEMAHRAQIEGDVIIQFIVSERGKPEKVVIHQERPAGLGFGEAGVKAIKAMRFTPGYQRDRAVRVRMQQVIRFRLD